jgi:hypothetical protein
MLVKEHQFKFYIGKNPRSILVEECVSEGRKWPQKFRANVPTSQFESRTFYASTAEGAAEQAAKYIHRSIVRNVVQISLHQIQLQKETG